MYSARMCSAMGSRRSRGRWCDAMHSMRGRVGAVRPLHAPSPPQGCIRTAVHRRRSPPPPPWTKVTIAGKTEIYRRENLAGPFLVNTLFVPDPPRLTQRQMY